MKFVVQKVRKAVRDYALFHGKIPATLVKPAVGRRKYVAGLVRSLRNRPDRSGLRGVKSIAPGSR